MTVKLFAEKTDLLNLSSTGNICKESKRATSHVILQYIEARKYVHNVIGSKSPRACEKDYSLWQRYRPKSWFDHTSHPTKGRLIALPSKSRSFLCSKIEVASTHRHLFCTSKDMDVYNE